MEIREMDLEQVETRLAEVKDLPTLTVPTLKVSRQRSEH